MNRNTIFPLLLLLPVFLLLNVFAREWKTGTASFNLLPEEKKRDTILYTETFSYPDGALPSVWWSEGNTAVIKDGRLYVDADIDSYRASTVWLDKRFSGNIRIEFDVQIVSSDDTANNINCFVLYSAPDGKHLRETSHIRKNGVYNHYHKLNGYIFTFVANKNPEDARIRFRDNPGFNLLAEDFGAEVIAGKTYQIKIEKRGSKFEYWVNGEKLMEKVDDEYNDLHNEGLFGFRTWHTALWWDNLTITQIE
jgi:hypothetical protein